MTGPVRERLWNQRITADSYAEPAAEYRAALLEQYKLYIEMADRISARRGMANTFFLTLNTTVSTVIGLLLQHSLRSSSWLLAFPLIALLVQCAAWFLIVRSYRQLNAAKYEVVGALEEGLPASPYWCAEWVALSEGRGRARYWPLTLLEQCVPILFGATYVVTFVGAMIAGSGM